MPRIFLTIIILMRLNTPSGYLLVFFPSLFGLFLAYEKLSNLVFIPIFFMGSVIVRSAGCIVNDFFDRDFDKRIKRTKNRPLANKKISKTLAFSVLVFLLILAFTMLLSLSFTSVLTGLISFCMIISYPLMKRFTHFPQVFLGLTFNMGCLIGYSAVKDDISNHAMLMYIGCAFWTFGYDTIYAFMDLKDDKKVGVKSSAVFLENKSYKMWIGFSYISFIICSLMAILSTNNIVGVVGILAAAPILFWQIITLDIYNVTNCFVRFNSNVYVGFVVTFFMFAGCVL